MSDVQENATDNTTDSEVVQADPAVAVAIAENDNACKDIAAFVVKTLDAPNMTERYAKMGKRFHAAALKQKASVKVYTKDDLKLQARRIEEIVQYSLPTRVDMMLYIRVYNFVDTVKAIVPNVENLSYYQITSKFLPMVKFDVVELTGEIRDGWASWLKDTIELQLSDSKLSMKELDARIATKTAEIAAERAAKITNSDPDAELARRLASESNKARIAKNAAVASIQKAVADAIIVNKLSGSEVLGAVALTANEHKAELPSQGFDPATANPESIKALAMALYGLGKLKEMELLHKLLGRMIETSKAQLTEAA